MTVKEAAADVKQKQGDRIKAKVETIYPNESIMNRKPGLAGNRAPDGIGTSFDTIPWITDCDGFFLFLFKKKLIKTTHNTVHKSQGTIRIL